MAILKTQGVVLKGWKLGETSKILSLYTRDHGKVKVVAKGARGQKSRFKGCLEPLTTVKAVYYDKRTRDLQLLSQCDCIDPHYRIIGDVQRTTLGLAAVELVDRAVVGEESYPGLFDLLADILSNLDRYDGFLEGLFWYFEMHFIGLMGYQPNWNSCLSCSGVLGGGKAYFQPQNGGLLCSRCGAAKGGLIVDGETLEILFWLQRCRSEEATRLQTQPVQKANIRKMFDLYFKSHIEHLRGLRSLDLFYEMSDA